MAGGVDALPTATTVARSLLALSRAHATGTLSVTECDARARIAVVEGTPRAIATTRADGDTLGDRLVRAGVLDQEAHRQALRRAPPAGPVGDWLVETGAASREDVERALRQQLRRRVALVFRWQGAELRFLRDGARVGVPHLERPEPAADLVLTVMRGIVADVSLSEALRRLPEGPITLTRLGESLLSRATLCPEEAAMVPPLRARADLAVVLAAAGRSPRAVRTLFALRLLAAVASTSHESRAYGLLLRKQRQLRRAVGAGELLDLGVGARPKEARQALRRLARVVHPDRFGADEAPAVKRASEEVMYALVQAERHLRER